MKLKEKLWENIFLFAAVFSILAVLLICVFLFGTWWKPGAELYGILPMIVGSFYVTAGAISVGVP